MGDRYTYGNELNASTATLTIEVLFHIAFQKKRMFYF
jgi:hypothetical protein